MANDPQDSDQHTSSVKESVFISAKEFRQRGRSTAPAQAYRMVEHVLFSRRLVLVEMVVAAVPVNPVLAGNPNKSLTIAGCEGVQVRMRALGAG